MAPPDFCTVAEAPEVGWGARVSASSPLGLLEPQPIFLDSAEEAVLLWEIGWMVLGGKDKRFEV